MYENFFGLSCLPFEDRIQLEFLYTNPDVEEVLASMECELRYRQGLGFVVGEAGTGKTLLIRSLLTKLDPQDPSIIVKCPVDGQIDVIRETCKGFGVTLPSQFNAKRGLARLRRRLQDARLQDRLPVLIIDQAENLNDQAMATLESLIDLGRDDNRLLTMLLVGQPRTIDMLGQPRFDRLRQQLSSELRLHKFTSAQTHDYITHRLGIAGAGEKEIFDPAAIAVIHIVTHGIPRLINRLADASMVAAYSAELPCVTAELVREMSAQQSQKSKPRQTIIGAVQEDDQMSKLVSRVDTTIQALKGDDISVTTTSHKGDGSTNLSERARTMIERLEQSLRQSEQSTTKIEHRAKSMVAELQDQLNELENETMRVSGVTNEVQPQLQRIENTCDRAVKVEAQLSAFAETLVERADSVQQRISLLMTAMTDADTCRENICMTTHQATETLEQSQQLSQSIQEDLSQVRKELKESQSASRDAVEVVRKQISHLNEDAQRQYALAIEKEKSQLSNSFGEVIHESIAEFKTSLSQLTHEALDQQRVIAKQITGEFVVAMESTWAKMKTDATQDVKKITLIKEEAFRHDVDAISKELAATIENTAAHTKQEVSKLESKTTDVLQASQKQLTLLQHKADTVSKVLAETIDSQAAQAKRDSSQLERKTEHAMQTTQKQMGNLTEKHNQAWEAIQKQHVAYETKHKSLMQQGVDLDSKFDNLTERAKATQVIVQDAKATVTDLQRDAQQTITGLTAVVESGRTMTTEVNTACGRIETLQRTVSNSLLEVGGTCERLNALSEKALQAQQASTKIEKMLNAQNGQSETLQRLVSQADKAVELLQPAVVAADEKAGRLQSHHAAASSLLNKLTKANVDGQSVVQQVEKASANAQQLTENTSSKIDRMIKDVWDLTAKAETVSKELSTTFVEAQKEDAKPAVTKSTTIATATQDVKETKDTSAQQDVALRSKAYEKLTDQVNTIAKVLSKAQDVAKSTREELADAKETYEKLTTISDTASQQMENLETLIKSAGGAIETHEQVQLETATSTQELQQHLAAMADTTDAGMQMISEFAKQTIDIERQLRSATRKSAQLQANVAEALAQPGEIVAGAKEQAAQLEQVCTAVRKVFSALSQTSLEAQEKIKLFNQAKIQAQSEFDKLKQSTGQAAEGIRSLGQTNIKQIKKIAAQASEGIQSITKSGLGNLQSTAKQSLERIHNESTRASETLSEWVQESKRAQQRLEHTMQQVPSISQTHPMPAASPMPVPIDYDADMASIDEHSLIAEKQASVESVTLQGENQAARKAKIKKLLEEARRVSAGTRS